MNNVFEGAQYIIDADPINATKWKDGIRIKSNQRNDLLNNYWGIRDRKYFSISNDDLRILLIQGKGKIMVQVENIDNFDYLSLKWLPYSKKDINETDHFFIFEESFFIGVNEKDIPNGILLGQGDVVVATIGQKDKQYFVILNQARFEFVNDPGGGGDPPGIGIKVPPGL